MTTTPDVPDAPRELDARQQLERWLGFLQRAGHFWPLPLLALLLGALGFGIFSFLHAPKFRSETVILYVDRGSGEEAAESSQAERSVTVRLKELLLSRPKLERVVSRFDLYPELRRAYGMVDAIEELKKHIEFRAPGGDTFSIAFEGNSASQAQRVTAELARLVIDGDSRLRRDQAKVAFEFLSTEKRDTETKLRATEQSLAAFMSQHPRFALDATPLANGAAIRASMAGAVAARPPTDMTWRPRPRASAGSATPAASPPAALPAATDQPAAEADQARARAALAAARENLVEQLSHYTAAHPDVRAAEAAVERANQRLASVTTGSARPAVPPAAAPGAEAAAPAATTAPSRDSGGLPLRHVAPAVAPGLPAERAQNMVDLETQWLQLTRAVTEARQRQDQIEAQLFRADVQAGSAEGGHSVQVNVIDPAFLPERPQPPGRTMVALIFGAAALALGVLAALLSAAFDERLFRARDAAGIVDVLVEVPRVTRRRIHVAT